MLSPAPSSLDKNALALRLAELAGDEREVQVEFLLHLAEFDLRRAYVEAGFASLWAYCLEVLHLREGAAGRRIGAMRVLVRFPRLDAALRDGRLSLSTIIALGPVLTEENLESLLSRAAYRTTREVEELVVSLQPRPAPAPGLRKLAVRAVEATVPLVLGAPAAAPAGTEPSALRTEAPAVDAETASPRSATAERRRPAELEPVAQDRWSLRAGRRPWTTRDCAAGRITSSTRNRPTGARTWTSSVAVLAAMTCRASRRDPSALRGRGSSR